MGLQQPDDDVATLMLGLCLKKQNTRLSDARLELGLCILVAAIMEATPIAGAPAR